MRLRNDPKAIEYCLNSPVVINEFPILLSKNDVIEIGMGKGEMLYQLAIKNPHINYIGIERFQSAAIKAVKRIEKAKLNNIKVITKDISKIAHEFTNKVNEIWLTFSDPWPKKRHAKRRLTHKDFLGIYKNLLTEDGILKIKTDNLKFFNWSIESITEYKAKIIYHTNDLHNDIKNKDNIYTGYEIKHSNLGTKINYLEVKF